MGGRRVNLISSVGDPRLCATKAGTGGNFRGCHLLGMPFDSVHASLRAIGGWDGGSLASLPLKGLMLTVRYCLTAPSFDFSGGVDGCIYFSPASLPSLPARLLCTMDDLHPTRKGIFSMDSCGARVATGSKDSTVSVASLRPTGLACDRWASQSPLIEFFAVLKTRP